MDDLAEQKPDSVEGGQQLRGDGCDGGERQRQCRGPESHGATRPQRPKAEHAEHHGEHHSERAVGARLHLAMRAAAIVHCHGRAT